MNSSPGQHQTQNQIATIIIFHENYRLSFLPTPLLPEFKCFGMVSPMCLSDSPNLPNLLFLFWETFDIFLTFSAVLSSLIPARDLDLEGWHLLIDSARNADTSVRFLL